MGNPSSVIVIDDHPVVLKGLRDLLASSDAFTVVAEAVTGKDGLAATRREQPDLIILDLRLSDAFAPDLCNQLRQAAPQAKVVILTAFDDKGPIQACLKAGAAGILLKDLHELDLIRALQEVLSGRTFIDERVGGEGLARIRRIQADPTVPHEALTPREYDVLRLVAQGMTSKEIADQLGLATNTVRGYTQSLISKLGARNRIQALATARKLRLI